MRSDAATVEAYIAEAPPGRRETLELLRDLCRDELAAFDEEMKYGMPSYLRDGEVEIAFASQKGGIAFYVLRQAALKANAARLAGLPVGKGVIRFHRPEQIEASTIRALLATTAADDGPIC